MSYDNMATLSDIMAPSDISEYSSAPSTKPPMERATTLHDIMNQESSSDSASTSPSPSTKSSKSSRTANSSNTSKGSLSEEADEEVKKVEFTITPTGSDDAFKIPSQASASAQKALLKTPSPFSKSLNQQTTGGGETPFYGDDFANVSGDGGELNFGNLREPSATTSTSNFNNTGDSHFGGGGGGGGDDETDYDTNDFHRGTGTKNHNHNHNLPPNHHALTSVPESPSSNHNASSDILKGNVGSGGGGGGGGGRGKAMYSTAPPKANNQIPANKFVGTTTTSTNTPNTPNTPNNISQTKVCIKVQMAQLHTHLISHYDKYAPSPNTILNSYLRASIHSGGRRVALSRTEARKGDLSVSKFSDTATSGSTAENEYLDSENGVIADFDFGSSAALVMDVPLPNNFFSNSDGSGSDQSEHPSLRLELVTIGGGSDLGITLMCEVSLCALVDYPGKIFSRTFPIYEPLSAVDMYTEKQSVVGGLLKCKLQIMAHDEGLSLPYSEIAFGFK